ncbi:MAG: hypothetical protein K2N17_06355 [Clostridia bacterium]|nr:hypothetical protein [Clostridia bacterium]
MGRKSTPKDKRERRYIRISSSNAWEQIDKLSTKERYANSFNMLINDALDYGLPLLIKEVFGEIDYDEETKQYNAAHSKEEEFYGQVVRLFKELIMNETINKAIVSSLFEAKRLELLHKPVSAEAFETGCFQDTPEFANDYELRELRKIRSM